jgi:hypothetical protein
VRGFEVSVILGVRVLGSLIEFSELKSLCSYSVACSRLANHGSSLGIGEVNSLIERLDIPPILCPVQISDRFVTVLNSGTVVTEVEVNVCIL